MRGGLKCFFHDVKGQTYTAAAVELRPVAVRSITGTVGKCGVLDRRFRPLRGGHSDEDFRRARINRLFRNPLAVDSIPPVRLYLYHGVYYVVDGHRRVSAAIASGLEFIRAQGTEVVTGTGRRREEGGLPGDQFNSETGITDIILMYQAGYRLLLEEIGDYPVSGSLEEKAAAWRSEEFLPACRKIERAGLLSLFGGMSAADIYVTILHFHRAFDSGFPRQSSFHEVLEDFTTRRGLSGWRRVWRRIRAFLHSGAR